MQSLRLSQRCWSKRLSRWGGALLLGILLGGLFADSIRLPDYTSLSATAHAPTVILNAGMIPDVTPAGQTAVEHVVAWLAALAGLGLLFTLHTSRSETPNDLTDTFDQLFASTPVGMALIVQDGRLVKFNDNLTTLLGYSADELQDRTFESLIHPDDRASFTYLKTDILKNNMPSARLEMRCQHAHNRIIWVRLALSRLTLPDDQNPYIVLYLDDYTIQKEMEQAFWEQILRNEMILQTATDGFCLFGLDGIIIEPNAAFAKITGYAQEYLTGMNIAELPAASETQSIMAYVPLVLEAGNQRFETRIRREDGTVATLSASLNLIDMGTQRFMFLSVRDVTDMNAAQIALHESQQMLRLVLNTIPTRVFWKDRNLRYLGSNRAFAEDAGHQDQNVITGMTDFDMPWKAQAESYRAHDSTVIESEEAIHNLEEPQQRIDGNRYWVRTSKLPLRNGEGHVVGVMGTYEDITDSKLAHDRLVHSEKRLQSIFNNAAAGILLLDQEGNFLHFNRQWASMLGYDENELFGLDLWDVTLPEERHLSRRKLQAMAQGEIDSYVIEKRYIRKDRTTFWARVSVTSVLDDNDELEMLVAMITDITDRKQAEQAMNTSEARYRSLFQDMPIALLELNFSAIKANLDALRQQHTITDMRDYLYGHPDVVIASADQIRTLDTNRATLALYEAPSQAALSSHLIRSFKEEAFEDFRLLLIHLAERHHQIALDTMAQTMNSNQRSVSIQVSLVPQYADTWERVIVAVQDITGRLEAEIALRESEDRYRRLFEDVPISLWEEDFSRARRIIQQLQASGITNLDAYFTANPDILNQCINAIRVLDVNQQTLQMYDATDKAEFLGPLSNVLPDTERAALQSELVAMSAGQHQIELEAQRQIAGQVRYLAISLSIAPGYETTWGRVLVSLTDITRLKTAEAAEHEQRTLAEALRDTAAALVSSLDPEVVLNRILDNLDRVVPHDAANIGLIEGETVVIHSWRGYGENETRAIEGLRLSLDMPSFRQMQLTSEPCLISDVTATEDWTLSPETEWVKSYAGVPIRAHGQVVGFLNLDSDKAGFFTEAHLERLQAFADQAAIAIENAQLYDEIRQHAADLQRRVEARTIELERERAQVKAILDAMGEGVVYTEDNEIRYVNDQILNMMGYDQSSLISSVDRTLMDALRIEDVDFLDYEEHLLDVLAKRRIWRGDGVITRSDDTAFDANLTMTLVGDADQRPVSIVTVVRDVSQERALQAQKDRFIANASHELRTPIANMKMRLYLLEKQPTKQPQHMEVLRYVTNRMETLVEELLDISRFERGVISLDRRNVHLQPLIQNVVTIEQATASTKDLTLDLHMSDDPIEADIDPNRITQVLNNLIANAMNYTPPQGTVTIRMTRTDSHAVLSVTDTGIGIPDDALDQIFEPFYRVSEDVARGTGLGLTISREIMDLHGGSLEVESTEGQGSTFTMYLPLE